MDVHENRSSKVISWFIDSILLDVSYNKLKAVYCHLQDSTYLDYVLLYQADKDLIQHHQD